MNENEIGTREIEAAIAVHRELGPGPRQGAAAVKTGGSHGRTGQAVSAAHGAAHIMPPRPIHATGKLPARAAKRLAEHVGGARIASGRPEMGGWNAGMMVNGPSDSPFAWDAVIGARSSSILPFQHSTSRSLTTTFHPLRRGCLCARLSP